MELLCLTFTRKDDNLCGKITNNQFKKRYSSANSTYCLKNLMENKYFLFSNEQEISKTDEPTEIYNI